MSDALNRKVLKLKLCEFFHRDFLMQIAVEDSTPQIITMICHSVKSCTGRETDAVMLSWEESSVEDFLIVYSQETRLFGEKSKSRRILDAIFAKCNVNVDNTPGISLAAKEVLEILKKDTTKK